MVWTFFGKTPYLAMSVGFILLRILRGQKKICFGKKPLLVLIVDADRLLPIVRVRVRVQCLKQMANYLQMTLQSAHGCLKLEIPAVKRFYRGLGTSSLQNVNMNLARRGHF